MALKGAENLDDQTGIPGGGKLTREGKHPRRGQCVSKGLKARLPSHMQVAQFATRVFIDSQKVRVTRGL